MRRTLLPLAVLVLLVGCQTASTPSLSGDGGGNLIRHMLTVPSSAALGNQPGVEIELYSPRAFPVRNEIVGLRIGARRFLLSRYAADGDTHVLIFTLTRDEFAQTANGEPVAVQYGQYESPERWDFGPLDKSRLDR